MISVAVSNNLGVSKRKLSKSVLSPTGHPTRAQHSLAGIKSGRNSHHVHATEVSPEKLGHIMIEDSQNYLLPTI